MIDGALVPVVAVPVVLVVVVLPPAPPVGTPGGGVGVPREQVCVGDPLGGQDLPSFPQSLLVGDRVEARDSGSCVLQPGSES